MEYQPFIIEVPAGEGHQEYCTIFNGFMLPKGPEVRPSEDDRRYGMTIDASLIADQEDLLRKLLIRENKVNIGSRFRPQIALRNGLGELSGGLFVAEYFESAFHKLHWIDLTPDRVVRYIQKRLLVHPFDYETRHQKGTILRLVAVEMNVEDIDASVRELVEAYRHQNEVRFGA